MKILDKTRMYQNDNTIMMQLQLEYERKLKIKHRNLKIQKIKENLKKYVH